MATTGIEIDARVVALVNDIVSNRTYRCAGFKIVNNKMVVDEELLMTENNPTMEEIARIIKGEIKDEEKEKYDVYKFYGDKLKLTKEPRYFFVDTNNVDPYFELVFW